MLATARTAGQRGQGRGWPFAPLVVRNALDDTALGDRRGRRHRGVVAVPHSRATSECGRTGDLCRRGGLWGMPCHRGGAVEGFAPRAAMQVANGATVLGDYANATLTHGGRVTTFGHSDGAYTVRTEGADGAEHEYRIAYTFGIEPLQQYLIAFPGGRYQALDVAWDSRPKERGGQRWFDLYPDQKVAAGDRRTGPGHDQTWNYQCAACHSSDLRKNYDLATNAYATAWSDVNVSCEACHGPGSRHVAWAETHGRTGSQRRRQAPARSPMPAAWESWRG